MHKMVQRTWCSTLLTPILMPISSFSQRHAFAALVLTCLSFSFGSRSISLAVDGAEYKLPVLSKPGTYEPELGVVDVELSEYIGYAGLILENNGLAPNVEFEKKYGFKLRLTLSENEDWSRLNRGELAASATTADVLALYGDQMKVTVPVAFDYSFGADGILVTKDIQNIGQLAGKIVVSARFNESDFFLRYWADQQGLKINVLASDSETPKADMINVLFTEGVDEAMAVFKADLPPANSTNAKKSLFAGCVGWEPLTSDLLDEHKNELRFLVTNKNLLNIADVLIVNQGFAEAQPKIVQALVTAVLRGNMRARQLQKKPNKAEFDLIAKALTTDPSSPGTAEDIERSIRNIYFMNTAENEAFFTDQLPRGDSFEGVWQSANRLYGSALVSANSHNSKVTLLPKIFRSSEIRSLSDGKISIPLLASNDKGTYSAIASANHDLVFQRNSAALETEAGAAGNAEILTALARKLKREVGCRILLRGHVDGSKLGNVPAEDRPELEAQALQLSAERAASVKTVLVDKFLIPEQQIKTEGVGASEPIPGAPGARNRRVEVRTMSLELEP